MSWYLERFMSTSTRGWYLLVSVSGHPRWPFCLHLWHLIFWCYCELEFLSHPQIYHIWGFVFFYSFNSLPQPSGISPKVQIHPNVFTLLVNRVMIHLDPDWDHLFQLDQILDQTLKRLNFKRIFIIVWRGIIFDYVFTPTPSWTNPQELHFLNLTALLFIFL